MSTSTAAVTSARFSFVAPVGRIHNCENTIFHLGDGGYADNSGAFTAAVVLERLRPLIAADNADPSRQCIVPILLQIENGAETLLPDLQPNEDPNQLFAPLSGAIASFNARDARRKVTAAALATEPLRDSAGREISVKDSSGQQLNRYVRIFPLAQAGQDASLGWLLSDTSIATLDTQRSAATTAALELLAEFSDVECEVLIG